MNNKNKNMEENKIYLDYLKAKEAYDKVAADYKNLLIEGCLKLIKSRPNEIGLNEKYENKYGWGNALTLTDEFGNDLKTFGTIERWHGMTKVTPAEKLPLKGIVYILNNLKNL